MATDLEQSHFRFRTDGDAADATPTWGDDEDTNYDPGASPFRLRLGLANLGDASSGSLALYLQKNAGSYAAITTASAGGVKSYDASSDADDTPIRIPRLSMTVDWQLAGAAIDLDFAGNKIYPSGAFTDYLSCSRASDGYAKNSSGDWVQFSSNVLRITDLGLLIENTRTNYLINSSTPVTQTTESLATGNYCLWIEGSGSAIASGGTATITGEESATDGSPSIFSVTVAGTVIVTVTGSPDRFQLERGNFASSYIPTGATSATRATDLVSCIGSLYTVLAGTARTSIIDLIATVSPNDLWAIVADSVGPLDMYASSNNRNLFGNGGLAVNFESGGYYSTGVKVAAAINGTAQSLTAAGVSVVTGTNGTNLTSTITLGSSGGANVWYGYFRRATFWNSKLADATLQSLTAP